MNLSVFRLTAVATLMAGSAATAGGYIAPIVEPPVTIVEPIAPLTWQGGYVGGTVGYGFGGDDVVGVHYQDNFLGDIGKLEASGPSYGLRAGFRGQRTIKDKYQWVFAGELSYEGANIDDEVSSSFGTAAVEVNNILALRLKSGLLNNAGNTWFYGIAGVGRIDYDYGFTTGSTLVSEEGRTSTGYIVGLGVERKFNEKWSMTGEWEYQNYGKETVDGGSDYSTETTPDFHTIKIGLNYQF
ncbi:MAG: outer membrane protein [Paracoccus sp. (in: a-proteobacteria)]